MRVIRVPAILLALVLLSASAVAATTLVTDINNSTANETHPFHNFDAPTSAVADFDGDGVPELVAHNDNQYVYVLATTTPRVLAEFKPPYPSGWGARPLNDPAVADVDADGKLDIVVVNSAGRVCVYEYEGGTSTTSMTFEQEWCRTMDVHDSPGADAGAAVEDVDGDGRMEIFSQVEKKGLYAYRHDGSTLWSPKAEWGGNAGPLVTDLENDGRKEVLFFSDGGTVRAYDAASGSSRWTFHAGSYVTPASIPLAGNAADIDGDGRKEVVFTARDAPAGDTNYDDNHLMVFVLSHTGSLQKRWQPSWANPLSYTHPVLVDVDGDGGKDILLQDWNTIGHKPGDWERLGPANVFAYRHDGTFLWRTELENSWSNDDLVVADVDGDGRQEVLAIGYNGGMDGVWYLDLRTGAKEGHVGVGSGWQALRGPVAGNLDGSGKTVWAVSVDRSGSSEGGFKIFRTDAACNVAFGGWQNDFGCGGGSTPPPPPPPTGDFDATFSSPGGNEWWLEISVHANEALAGVQVSLDGGSWKPLELKSWGDWAASYHAPDGTIVQFRATSTSGATDVSGCYRWTGKTSVDCGGSTPPPPPPDGVTFEHAGGNEWWVEAKVSPAPSAVQAMDTGGAWVSLELKSWGEWAASFHIEPGHQVRFRAMHDGAWTESCWYTHPDGAPQCDETPPPPTGDFSATFKNVRGNEWWVETDVTVSGGTLAGVDARVNGGGWIALDRQSWGSWAKSFHVSPGSAVEFRARATDGQTATSAAYTWPPG